MIHVWINEGSGWFVESIESEYINISTYRPFSGSSYMNLHVKLKGSRNGLTNIKNKDQKCFLCCHIRHINPSKEHPERIRKIDKNIAEKLNYDAIEIPVQEKYFSKIEVENNICITCLVMKINWFFQFMFQIKNLKTQWICCF